MRIAVDVMGGDFAPQEIIRGAEAAVREWGFEVILVGNEEAIAKYADSRLCLPVVRAPQVVQMDESPVVAVKRKPDSSVVKAVELVKDGRADAAVSAGHTGATFAASLFRLGRIRGVERPALASVIPNEQGQTVLLDIGANVDCKPGHLLKFGIMGSLYARQVLGVPNPRVGLLSIGEEASKGNEQTLTVFPLFERAPFDFVGNVEGGDLFSGRVDVVVCDGFVGNIALKTGEGVVRTLEKAVKQEVATNWVSKVCALPTVYTLRNIRKRFDYTEYGGAPLLGVNGVVVVSHGRSNAKAVKNAIRVAGEAVRTNLVGTIAGGIGDVRENGAETADG